jgi:hypothetical protein
MHSKLVLSLLIVLMSSVAAFAGDDVPSWLQQAASTPVPTYDKDVPAVVLLNDQRITVSDDGHVVRTRTYAVKILTREGRSEAVAREIYQTDTGKVKDLQAWLIRPSGPAKHYGKDQTVDLALAMNDVYNEYRAKAIVAEGDADSGVVFGYQMTSEDRSIFSQFEWEFQDRTPALVSRVSLALPNGWKASSVTFNHGAIEPNVSGSTYTWELRELSPITNEPLSPPVSTLAPRLAISYFPGSSNSAVKTFAEWAQVSQWMAELEDPQANSNEALETKARELIAACKTELEKIQAIGRYAQSIKYISIQTGVGRGGGYRPHSATEVFTKSYGDCKDKANLMRAMLKVIGITSYPVSIYSGDPTYVRAEWPSPQQFNHCIIAIKVSGDTQSPTIIEHARLGRLLIFDPTAEDTAVGDLPSYLQGSLALIDAKEIDSLVKMPTTTAEANLLDRQVEATLDQGGALTATIREQANGQWGAGYRGELRGHSRPDYVKQIEGWVTAGATAAKVNKVEPRDNAAGEFDLDIDFVAPRYGQLMQNRLLIFKPAIVSRREALALTDAKRKHPVVLSSQAFSETLHVKLPSGFAVDELPDAVNLDTPFGTYATKYEVKNDELLFTRKLVQRAVTVPVDQYSAVRSFFEKIRAAEQAPVVLARQ